MSMAPLLAVYLLGVPAMIAHVISSETREGKRDPRWMAVVIGVIWPVIIVLAAAIGVAWLFGWRPRS